MKTLSLGMDIGTSKICVTAFEIDSKRINCLSLDTSVTIPTKIAILKDNPVDLRTFPELDDKVDASEFIIVESTKRCVICEWSYQLGKKELISELECLNLRNFYNADWCGYGRHTFTIKQKMEWRPSHLFIQLLSKTIKLTETALEKEYGKDYAISEVKVGVPMVFHRQHFYVEQLEDSVILSVVKGGLKDRLTKDYIIKVIHEPISALMAYAYGKDKNRTIPPGYLIVIDSGAGTTDIVLCHKKGNKISFIGFDSWTLAGDDYDRAMERVIGNAIIEEKIHLNKEQISTICRQQAKIQKEYYCQHFSAPTISVPSLKPITLAKDKIEEEFSKVNERIAEKIRSFMVAHKEKAITKLYLTGGCINVQSLIDKVQEALNIKPKDYVTIDLEDLVKVNDPEVVSVSVGASIPTKQYESIMLYNLPYDIIIEEETISDNLEERFKKIATLYKANQQDWHGKVTFGVSPKTKLIFRIITDEGNRDDLCKINTVAFFRERKHSTFNLTVEYLVDYNSKLRISVFSNHVPEKKEIFNDFVIE